MPGMKESYGDACYPDCPGVKWPTVCITVKSQNTFFFIKFNLKKKGGAGSDCALIFLSSKCANGIGNDCVEIVMHFPQLPEVYR